MYLFVVLWSSHSVVLLGCTLVLYKGGILLLRTDIIVAARSWKQVAARTSLDYLHPLSITAPLYPQSAAENIPRMVVCSIGVYTISG